jgi:hypothetical protein
MPRKQRAQPPQEAARRADILRQVQRTDPGAELVTPALLARLVQEGRCRRDEVAALARDAVVYVPAGGGLFLMRADIPGAP